MANKTSEQELSEKDLDSAPEKTTAETADPTPKFRTAATDDSPDGDPRPKDRIEYVGPATQRTILKSDWHAIEIEGEKVEWNFGNHFAVAASEFNGAQLQYLLSVDGRFKRVTKS